MIGIDRFDDRLRMAQKQGVEVIDYREMDDITEAVKAVSRWTDELQRLLAPDMYDAFRRKEPGVVKVVLRP